MDIKNLYDLKIKKVIQIGDEYEIYVPHSKLYLEHVNLKEWQITCTASIINHVTSNGFYGIDDIVKSKDGKAYVNFEGRTYVMVKKAEGLKLKLKNRKDILSMAEFSAAFHNAAEGFVESSGNRVIVKWGKRMEKCRKLLNTFEKYSENIKETESCDEFQELTRQYADNLLNRSRASMKILRSLEYLKALENSMKKKEVCLNSISNGAAIASNGKITYVKIFNMGYNMVEEDLADLVKRSTELSGDLSLYDDIMEKYLTVRKLGSYSSDVVKALAAFPYDSIKVILKYMDDKTRGEELIKKLKKNVAKEMNTNLLGV